MGLYYQSEPRRQPKHSWLWNVAFILLTITFLVSAGGLLWHIDHNVCMPMGGKWCYATLEDAYHIPDGFCIVKFIGDEPVAEPC